ncbi:MAG: DNA gyrase inhibitor YacG [Nitrospirota bacterium]|nr:MAG: DNA gyrase inhibitor YacG [Nitrospirota bacterium]
MDCPICSRSSKWEGNKWRPFCSERCKMIDLGEWASEGYSIEAGDDDDTENNKEEEG